MQQLKLQQKAKELLTDKTVDVIIGYGSPASQPSLVLITDPADTDQLIWNDRCTQNLAVYLRRKEVRTMGKAAIVVKGCDAKSLVVLEAENQIDRNSMVVIGMECCGVKAVEFPAPSNDSATRAESNSNLKLSAKCLSCEVTKPLNCDVVIEQVENSPVQFDLSKRYERLEKLTSMTTDERLKYWENEFSRCIKCYACRQSCPLCYCEVCVVDKNRPVRIDVSATLRGNFAWNILRAFHLAGRCVGCSACSEACPAGIDLDLLNLSLAKAAEENFNHKAGLDRSTNLLIGTFSPEDHEEFIR
ncbi:MAG: 4Fe-4S dicluster domain-containing protein [Planctomycetaceae bacterium]|jgi:heterodisulfide reductase subunit C|nr:4Fe-4S dicluster domain-containing protein [Planctomycetaceae bacterium]